MTIQITDNNYEWWLGALSIGPRFSENTSILCKSLLVCWVICFQSQNETSKLSPEVSSILAAYLRNTHLRDPDHPSPANP